METNRSEIASQFREAGASKNRDNAHVIISNGNWKLVKEGNQRATFIYPSKEEAILEAKNMANPAMPNQSLYIKLMEQWIRYSIIRIHWNVI